MNMYVGTLGLEGDWRSDSRPGQFTTADRALDSRFIRSSVGPRDSLNAKGNRRILNTAGNRTPIMQPVT
jgi:hypothetical protein